MSSSRLMSVHAWERICSHSCHEKRLSGSWNPPGWPCVNIAAHTRCDQNARGRAAAHTAGGCADDGAALNLPRSRLRGSCATTHTRARVAAAAVLRARAGVPSRGAARAGGRTLAGPRCCSRGAARAGGRAYARSCVLAARGTHPRRERTRARTGSTRLPQRVPIRADGCALFDGRALWR